MLWIQIVESFQIICNYSVDDLMTQQLAVDTVEFERQGGGAISWSCKRDCSCADVTQFGDMSTSPSCSKFLVYCNRGATILIKFKSSSKRVPIKEACPVTCGSCDLRGANWPCVIRLSNQQLVGPIPRIDKLACKDKITAMYAPRVGWLHALACTLQQALIDGAVQSTVRQPAQ